MRDHDHNPLAARLGAQRLARPGVLDRTPVERTYERLQQGTVKHELTGRLHQRATASGEAGGSSFVWRRSPAPGDASAEGLTVPAWTTGGTAAATSVPAASSTPISKTTSPVVQRVPLPDPESAAVTARLASRAHSPGVVAEGSTISRPAAPGAFSSAPAFAAHLQSRYGVTAREAATAAAPVQTAPALSITRAPAGVVRRQVDTATTTAPPPSRDSASVVSALSRVSHGITAAPVLARQTLAGNAMAGPLPLAGDRSLAAPESRTADAPGSPRVPDLPMTPAARPLLSAGSAAGGPLVLRRMLAAPAQSGTPMSTVMPPAGVQLPREETPAPLPPKSEPVVVTSAGAHPGADIDRIAEEVGRRLMRRLQIERERKGIRQWR